MAVMERHWLRRALSSRRSGDKTVIPGWSEGPDPESRDSGFDASHRPGMTDCYFCPILPSVPVCSRLMFSRWVQNRSNVSTANSEASAGWPKYQRKIGVTKLATSAESDE